MNTDKRYPDMKDLFAAIEQRKARMTPYEKAVQAEVVRQLAYGLTPSEGLPDVRPRWPRYRNKS